MFGFNNRLSESMRLARGVNRQAMKGLIWWAAACIAGFVMLIADSRAQAAETDWADMWVKGLRPYNMVTFGLEQYYKLNGRWPSSWQAVREAGIIQVDLYDAAGNSINPDDGVVGAWGDVAYAGPDGSGKAVIRGRLTPANQISSKAIGVPGSYLQAYSQDRNKLPADAFDLESLLDDRAFLTLCAMTGMLEKCISEFTSCHGRNPRDLAEFMSSPFAPFTSASSSPVTGHLLKLDGSAGDISVGSFETEAQRQSNAGLLVLPALAPVFADGRVCPYQGMY